MDPIKARLNEINFLEFCTRIEAIRHRPIDIKLFIGYLANLIDFDIETISAISEKIFTPIFYVHKNEIYTLLENKYIKMTDLDGIYNKSLRTLYRYINKSDKAPLYPRLNPEEQEALDKFMSEYEKVFTKDYKNIFNEIGGN